MGRGKIVGPGPRDSHPAPSRGPLDTPSINVTPSLDINYILNGKISLQDQNCELIENTVILDHCINRCINRVKCELFVRTFLFSIGMILILKNVLLKVEVIQDDGAPG